MSQNRNNSNEFFNNFDHRDVVLDLSKDTDDLLGDIYQTQSSKIQAHQPQEQDTLGERFDHIIDTIANYLFQGWLTRTFILRRVFDVAKYTGLSLAIFTFLFGIANWESYYIQLEYAYQERFGSHSQDSFLADINRDFDSYKATYEERKQLRKEINHLSSLDAATDIQVPEAGYGETGLTIIEPSTVYFEPRTEESRVIIPKIRVNAPIAWSDSRSETAMLDALKTGIAHFPGTALPGQYGNSFITGHSSYYSWAEGDYKSIFALLHKMNIGDDITIWHEGQEFVYRIYDSFVVTPDNLDVLDQIPGEKILTVMTCTPIGTNTNRLIYRARLLES